ncbi:MarR family transcriptional regulator [Pseudonocardia sp. DR1-2]|uniref:MarR family winged helix-turn-helix transcriptional regulator n=1 Tax=Pseudonocardia sp. DR1-2 TaxID=2951168 RepID=UPI00204494B8|nr:MarR family transcriptional regulator [Pseudonocardia sp. DR1-2]MCM3848220.1 MarR family transcriptional regulator [Pseudonocardia sp. DR1-2]
MPSTDAAELWKLNHRLLTRVLHAATPELERLGLGTKEFFVLDEIDTSHYPAELAQRLMLPKASVTQYLRTLVDAGLVRREIDDADLRRHRLAVTEQGRAVLSTALDALAAEFARMTDRIDGQDRAALRRILRALLDADTPGH